MVALEGEVAVGCGAFRELSDDTAEIKRMYARKKSSGVGGKILPILRNRRRNLDTAELSWKQESAMKRRCHFISITDIE